MADTSEFEALSFRKNSTCLIGRLDLSKEQREKLDAAVDKPAELISTAAIARVLTNWEFPVNPETVRRHRGRRCSCYQ